MDNGFLHSVKFIISLYPVRPIHAYVYFLWPFFLPFLLPLLERLESDSDPEESDPESGETSPSPAQHHRQHAEAHNGEKYCKHDCAEVIC